MKIQEYECFLTRHSSKVNKNVLLLSTLHTYVFIEDDTLKNPNVLKFCNETKFEVHIR